MENSANTESQVMENLVNTVNWVVQDSGGKKPEEGKGDAPIKRGIMKTVKESWPRKKKRKSVTIGLTVYDP
jgi:hypothetical protein